MPTKKVWDKRNPKKKSEPLTSAQNQKAKRSAKADGRGQPSLVDNINAAKPGKKGRQEQRRQEEEQAERKESEFAQAPTDLDRPYPKLTGSDA